MRKLSAILLAVIVFILLGGFLFADQTILNPTFQGAAKSDLNMGGHAVTGLSTNSLAISSFSTNGASVGWVPTFNGSGVAWAAGGSGGGGSGTVTTFSSGNLSPLFTTSVATATTTPALSYALSNAATNAFLAGPASGSAAAPTYRSIVAADIPTLGYLPISGGTMTGNIAMGTNNISGSYWSIDGSNGAITVHSVIASNDESPSGYLRTSDGTGVLNWPANTLISKTTGNASVDWDTYILQDSNNHRSVDWTNRQLFDSTGTAINGIVKIDTSANGWKSAADGSDFLSPTLAASTYMPLAGGTFTGNVGMGTNSISGGLAWSINGSGTITAANGDFAVDSIGDLIMGAMSAAANITLVGGGAITFDTGGINVGLISASALKLGDSANLLPGTITLSSATSGASGSITIQGGSNFSATISENATSELTANRAIYLPNASGNMLLDTSNLNASNISSGTIAAARMPALTGDVTSTAGSVATTVGRLNGVSLAGLATGILKNTTSTGVPSIAIASDFPTLNQSTNGNSATTTGLSVASGKTLTSSNTVTLTATDGSTLAIGGGGTLGTAAYTASTAYAPAAGSASITTLGTIGTGTWQGTVINATYLPVGSSSSFGAVKVDGTTITASGGVISAVGGGGGTNPLTTLGDLLYGGTSGVQTRLAGNTVANDKVLVSHGTGSASTAPTLSNAPAISGTSFLTSTIPDAAMVHGASFRNKFTRLFTSSGTYTPTAGLVYCDIEVVAGGGGGGGTSSVASASAACGGGGSGAIAKSFNVSAATIGSSQTVTVGAFGAGSAGAAGGNGGSSSLGTLVAAGGGVGGAFVTSANVAEYQAGAAGGTATAGGILINGNPGGYGAILASSGFFSGAGGVCVWGSCGASLCGKTAGFSGNGNAASGFGSGGSGAALYAAASTSLSGGNGAPGMVIITEYCTQ